METESPSSGNEQLGSSQSLNTTNFSQFNSNPIDINSAFGPVHHVEQTPMQAQNNVLMNVLMQSFQQQHLNSGVAHQLKSTNPLSPVFAALQQNNLYNNFNQSNGTGSAVTLNALLQQLQQQLNANGVVQPTITSAFSTNTATNNLSNPLLFANAMNVNNCTTTNSNGTNSSPPASAFYSPIDPKANEIPKVNGEQLKLFSF